MENDLNEVVLKKVSDRLEQLQIGKYAKKVAKVELITTIANPIVENNYSYRYSNVDNLRCNFFPSEKYLVAE